MFVHPTKRRAVWLLAGCVLATSSVRGQEIAGRELVTSRVDSIFAKYNRTDAPGCVVGAARAGEMLYARGYGMADVAHGIPLMPETKLWIASASKQFTALAVLMMAEEGRFSLDDDAREYVPSIARMPARITIRDLLNHTSGLREQWNLFYMAGWRSSDVESSADLQWLLERQRGMNHAPGTEFLYNNTDYSVLAMLVERASGIPFARFVRERILAPLGMRQSLVRERANQVIEDFATGYAGHDAHELLVANPPYSFVGPTGVVSTVLDLMSWNSNFSRPRVGNTNQMNAMSTAGHLLDGTLIPYGMGEFIGTHQGFAMVSHSGSDPGFRAEVVRFPTESLSISVLCNASDIAPTPLALAVADLYLPARAPNAGTAATSYTGQSAAELVPSALAGLYWDGSSVQTRRFFFRDGALILDGGSEGEFALRVLGHNTWQLVQAPRRYLFTFTSRAGAVKMEERIEGSAMRAFARVPDSKPTIAVLRAAVGTYYSAELDVRWTIVLRDGKLVLTRHRMPDAALAPVFGELFQVEDFLVLTFIDKRGVPYSTLDVTTERARHVRFERE